eukprot:3940973-Rhodomonas_salina.9
MDVRAAVLRAAALARARGTRTAPMMMTRTKTVWITMARNKNSMDRDDDDLGQAASPHTSRVPRSPQLGHEMGSVVRSLWAAAHGVT